MGGEEFVMLLPETDAKQAKDFANFLRCELSEITIGDTDKTITVSIGASELSEHESAKDWLKQADNCLYQAKAQGRNQVIIETVNRFRD